MGYLTLGLLILPLIVMKKQVYINIKELVQVRPPALTPLTGHEFQIVPSIPNAFLVLEDNTVIDFGDMDSFDDRVAAANPLLPPLYETDLNDLD